jgi:hypothetical protein
MAGDVLAAAPAAVAAAAVPPPPSMRSESVDQLLLDYFQLPKPTTWAPLKLAVERKAALPSMLVQTADVLDLTPTPQRMCSLAKTTCRLFCTY